METQLLQFLASKSPPPTIFICSNPSTRIFSPCRRRSLRLNATNSTNSDDTSPPPTITPTDTVGIRFKRGSRRRDRQRKKDDSTGVSPPVKAKVSAPKKWEDMTLSEKAMELYVGEKGLLFWLNKFAYASIFITIGCWILFRFVGPALNLYQLDTAPLPPSAIVKG